MAWDSFFSDTDIANVDLPELNLSNASDILSQYLSQQTNLDDLSSFSAALNKAYQDQLLSTAPELLSGIKQASANTSSLLKGEIPQDVADAISRSAAAQSYGTGVGVSSGMGRNLVARDLGLTSLNLQNQGLSNLSAVGNIASAMNPTTVSQMLFTPQQLMQQQNLEDTTNYSTQLQEYMTNAQINQANASSESPFDSLLGNTIGSIVSTPFNFVSNIAGQVGNLPNTFANFYIGGS